ncbi:MAG: TRAP transporter TatT component family protein, partial [Myxococcota bacterium]
FGLVLLALLTLPGCDLAAFGAKSVGNLTARGAGGVGEHWDYELIRDGLAGGILRLEGLYRVAPDDHNLRLQLVRGYVSYGWAFLEDEIEELEANYQYEEAEPLRRRTALLYERAIQVGRTLLADMGDGFDEASEDAETLTRWLNEHADDEEDAVVLFWVGYAFALSLTIEQDPADLLRLPVAEAFVERSVELYPSYFNYAGTTTLAVIAASLPDAAGGDAERARELFERVLTETERVSLTVQYNYARTYAVKTGNRELFDSLIQEVVEAGDVSGENRFSNKIARRRARRLRAQADELFY